MSLQSYVSETAGPRSARPGSKEISHRAQNREWLVLKGDSEGGRRKVQQDTGSSQHRDTGKGGQVPEFCDCNIQESPPPPSANVYTRHL